MATAAGRKLDRASHTPSKKQTEPSAANEAPISVYRLSVRTGASERCASAPGTWIKNNRTRYATGRPSEKRSVRSMRTSAVKHARQTRIEVSRLNFDYVQGSPRAVS